MGASTMDARAVRGSRSRASLGLWLGGSALALMASKSVRPVLGWSGVIGGIPSAMEPSAQCLRNVGMRLTMIVMAHETRAVHARLWSRGRVGSIL